MSDDLGGFSMMALFRTEVEDQAASLSNGLLALERDPNANSDIEAMMRAAHSIKGAARMVQMDPAVGLSHAMEDYFVAVQEDRMELAAEHIDILLKGVDILVAMVQIEEDQVDNWVKEHGAELGDLVSAIEKLGSGEEAAPAPAPEETLELVDLDEPDNAAEEMFEIIDFDEPDAEPDSAEETPTETNPPLKDAVAEKPDTDPGQPPEKSPPTPPNEPQGSAERASQDRVVRVSSENLNRLMGLAGESLVEARWLIPFSNSLLQLKSSQLSLAQGLEELKGSLEDVDLEEETHDQVRVIQQDLEDCRQILTGRLNEVEEFARRSESLSDRLYREVVASRMRPFADGIQGFPRLVRDIARQLGKQAKLEILGRTTEVDRDILEKLEAPLNHLLRNALDHGLETPEERQAAGKSAEGTIRLEARHVAGMLSISVSDDGHGVDLERLRAKVVRQNLASEEMAEQLSEAELLDFLFLPSFSTADQVTEISGRGVGLDVVHSMVQEVSGVLRAISHPGQGMEFYMQLPLTLSVTRTLLVDIGGEPYAFPLARIDRILKMSRDEIEIVGDHQYCRFEEHNIGLVPARQVLELEGFAPEGDLSIVVVSDRLNRYGVVVDSFIEERDLVVRPLDTRLGKVPDISAAAFMEDGSPVLIIDVEDLVRSIDNLISGGRLRKVGRAAIEADREHKRILVVDDSITVREVERKLLENQGYHVEVAVDGMDGWNAVRSATYDLVVSDVDMPRMTGIELVSAIKQDPHLKSLPVMIVSYKDREEDRMAGLEAGANYYLTKSSFHDETLLNAVVDLIGEAQR